MVMTFLAGLMGLGLVGGQTVPDARAVDGSLFVNHVKVLTVRAANGGASPAQIAAKAAERIAGAKGTERAVAEIRNGASVIFVGGKPVLTVTRAEASAQLSDMKALGEAWAAGMNRAFDVAPLSLTTTTVSVPLGGTRGVAGSGAALGRAKYTVSDPNVASVSVGTGELVVKGIGRGTAVVEGVFGESRVRLEVAVLPLAANLPQTLTAQVMGQPATPEVVASAVATAAATRLGMGDGGRVLVGDFTAPELAAGTTGRVSVPVSVAAPGHFPVSGRVTVQVANIGSGRVFEDLLWYSNNPENLVGVGNLYWGELTRGVPVRMLAHHYNKTSMPMAVQYVVVNRSGAPASLAVTMGDAEPDKDPTKAGYRAGNEFFRNWLGHSAEVVQMPPGSVVPLILRRLAPTETMSALATLRLLEGECDSLTVIALNRWSAQLPNYWVPSLQRARPWQYVVPMPVEAFDQPLDGQPKEVYVRPLRQLNFEYEHGGRFAFIRIGQEAIESPDGAQKLLGNFGVHYLIEGTIKNPSDRRQKVEVVFEASAGYSGAIFTVNGQYKDARLLQTKQLFPLLEATLEPGEVRPVRIQTVPLSGAHYPATITVRPPGDH